jgi:tetratricopeptide (TPR) repeat protein
MKDYDKAISHFHSAWRLIRSSDSAILLADALIDVERYADAKFVYELAIKQYPLDINAWHGKVLTEEKASGQVRMDRHGCNREAQTYYFSSRVPSTYFWNL